MKILRFETESPKNYPNFRPYQPKYGQPSEKIRLFGGNVQYYKLGTQVIEHPVGWKIKCFFQTFGLALLFPVALCSEKYRERIWHTWKNFKSGEERISIYVRKQILVPETTTAEISKINTPLETPITGKLKATPDELKVLIDCTKDLKDLLLLFSFRNNVTFSQENLNQIKEVIKEKLEHLISMPSLKEEEWKILNQLFPFHPKLIKELEFLTERNLWVVESIFSYSLNDIPPEFLTSCLNTLLERLRNFKHDAYIVSLTGRLTPFIVHSCQNANLNELNENNLSLIIQIFDHLQGKLPQLETLSNEKITNLVNAIKNTCVVHVPLNSLINQIGQIPNEEQRKNKLSVIFEELQEDEIKFYLLHPTREGFQQVCLNVLHSCTDMHKERDKKSLEQFLQILRYRHDEKIEEKIIEEVTVDQAIFLLECDKFSNSGLNRASIIRKAITSDVRRTVEVLNPHQLFSNFLHVNNAPEEKLLLKEIIRTLKIEEFLKQDPKYRNVIFSEATVDQLNTYVDQLVLNESREEDNRKIEKFFEALTYYNLEIMTFFETLGSDLLEDRKNLLDRTKFSACYDAFVGKHPNKIEYAFKGFVSTLETSIRKLSNSNESVNEKLNQIKKNLLLIDSLRKKLKEPTNLFIKRSLDQLKTSEDLLDMNLFLFALAVKEKGIFSNEELCRLTLNNLKFNDSHLAIAFVFMNLDNQKYLIRHLIEKFDGLPPQDLSTNPNRILFDTIKNIKLVLSPEEIARLELDPATHDLYKFT